ncbi:MAG TPA: VgrG-related protein [Actinomycetota bacterium]|nr:VgrG-related protein [Actinomycetota bacterium]
MGGLAQSSSAVASYSINHLVVKVDGAPLSPQLMSELLGVAVEDALSRPASFALTFNDPEHTLLGNGFDFGATVALSLGEGKSLLEHAEVTAKECEVGVAGHVTVVRGFDLTHRLHRGRRTEVYKDVLYSDVAQKIAARAGLSGGTIDTPSMSVRPHVMQWNTSDWDFLNELAEEVDFEVGLTNGKLSFVMRSKASSAPSAGGVEARDPLQLTLKKVSHFRCVVSGAQQVGDVEVRGWDPKTKAAVIGAASATTSATQLSSTPAAAAGVLNGKTLASVENLYDKQSDADAAATALAEQIGSAFGTFEGTTQGNPDLKAGVAVSLGLAGPPFEGKYALTATRHTIDEDGYQTWFASAGSEDTSLLGLASNTAEHRFGEGVVPAIVSDVRDPDNLGRVKVTFPWLSSTNESYWARVTQPWAGKDYGAVFLPEVKDEVLVAFEQGDFARPYVVGALYNGLEKPSGGDNPLVDEGAGTVNVRRMTSRQKHGIELVDKFGAEGIFVRTGDGKNKVELDVANTSILVHSDGSVTISSMKDLKITSTGGNVEIGGREIKLAAQAQLELKSTAAVVIQGNVVKIN